jgi:hypothetical protein
VLYGMTFIRKGTMEMGFAVGWNGTIRTTTNGGETWTGKPLVLLNRLRPLVLQVRIRLIQAILLVKPEPFLKSHTKTLVSMNRK